MNDLGLMTDGLIQQPPKGVPKVHLYTKPTANRKAVQLWV